MNLLPLTSTTSAPSGGADQAAKQTVFALNGDFRDVLQRFVAPSNKGDLERGVKGQEGDAAFFAAAHLSWPILQTSGVIPSAVAATSSAGIMANGSSVEQKPTPPKQTVQTGIERKRDAAHGTRNETAIGVKDAATKNLDATGRKAAALETVRDSLSRNMNTQESARKESVAAQIVPRQTEARVSSKHRADQARTLADMAYRVISNRTARAAARPIGSQKVTAKKDETTDKGMKGGASVAQHEPRGNEKSNPVQPTLTAASTNSKKERTQTSLSNNKSAPAKAKIADNKTTATGNQEAVGSQPSPATSPFQATKLAAPATTFVRITAEKIRELQAMIARAVQGLMTSADGVNETVFRWNEPQLGRLSFRVATNGDDVSLDIRADRRDVATALEQNHTAIEQALANTGLKLQTFDVQHAPLHTELADTQHRHERYGEQHEPSAANASAETGFAKTVSTPEQTSEARKPIWVEHEWVA
jgi:hypothetical protein